MSNDRLKFRVWDVYRNKMIWGNCNLMLNLDGYKLWQVEHDTPRFIVEQSKFILMQCTGIKDKTGKLIFESDIVKQQWVEEISDNFLADKKGYRVGEVYWAEGHGGLAVQWKDEEISFTMEIPNIEVIGNIYENKDLLINIVVMPEEVE